MTDHTHVTDDGARAVYEAVKVGIDGAEPWESLPSWRRWRYVKAYRAAVAHHTSSEPKATRPANTRRIA